MTTARRQPSAEIGAAIVALIVKQPRKLTELATLMGSSRDTVRRHLRALAAEGLLSIEPECRSAGRFGRLYGWAQQGQEARQ